MEGNVREVLYEARLHVSRPFATNYPPQQLNQGARGGVLSLLSNRGFSQLKEKWRDYRHPRKVKKWLSLFISKRGERVAVAIGSRITILQKGDDYAEPCGVFSSNSSSFFACGTWSESHDVLGVVDDSDTLYFIKGNGEEIIRITRGQLKVSLPVIGLIFPDDNDKNHSFLCSFNVLTSDGFLNHIEIGREPSSAASSIHTSKNRLTLKCQFPDNVFCVDYCPEHSLFAVVGNASSSSVSLTSNVKTEPCYLSLWRRVRNWDLDLLSSAQLEGLFNKPRGYVGLLTSPKVLLSPQRKFVATLNITGCLAIFKLDEECCSLSSFSCANLHTSQATSNLSNGVSRSLSDIADFVWWSDHILTLANMDGFVTMIDIINDILLLESDVVYSMPVLEKVQQFQGHFFLLENTLSEERPSVCNQKEMGSSLLRDLVTDDTFNHIDITKFRWSLISFSERSISEMYNLLICEKKYQAALEFADRHGLDRDGVFKSQWLNSGQGVNEINLFLSKVKDQAFVLSECVEKVGTTEDAIEALLEFGLRLTDQYRFSDLKDQDTDQIWDFCVARLKLLQYKDRLETFIGINMGRFSVQEYSKFRIIPVDEAAITIAESGKIGALNLLFKRHPYSLAPLMLKVLSSVPETIPVHTYGQLLPGRLPPAVSLRGKDWVECDEMVNFINKLPANHKATIQVRTEPIVQKLLGFYWPSVDELCKWYKNRAIDIDTCSGQLDNCLCLLDFACRKGIFELQQFLKDISYLHQLVYLGGNGDEINFTMSLVEWERLSDYEKFKMMLKGVKEDAVIETLRDKAIPFVQNRFSDMNLISEEVGDDHLTMGHGKAESYLVRWLKEIASANKLDIFLMVVEEGCKEFRSDGIFKDEVEAVSCVLECMYLSSIVDRWSTMAAILSMLPPIQGTEISLGGLGKKLKVAEGHIEAGRLLAFYQVPKPMGFFIEANSDGKFVKQILRLMLSKFIRRQPGRSDNDWANLWRDMQCLHEKAFPFLELEYMLVEFCRGLLKAGKFSLARNYLKGIGSVALAPVKAENLVIQAAREYFFSASSLTCSEIWKAKECLNLFPSSRNVKAESDIIDAVTIKLPYFGITLLPMQFRQIKDPMEIIKLAITNQSGAYVHVDELIEIAKLFGLSSLDDVSAVEEAIAREAAVAGDIQLAFDLCLVLSKKGHGPIWDLCAAIARGPTLENVDISSRKQLLGFALSHCDEESIGELLQAWKDLDMQGQCENLMMLSVTNPPNFYFQGSSYVSIPVHSIEDIVNLRGSSELIDGVDSDNHEVILSGIKSVLSLVAKNLPAENGTSWDSLLRENGKVLSFAALQLPWLLELSRKTKHGKTLNIGSPSCEQYENVGTFSVLSILSWLARIGFAPRDDLIASLAKSILEPPVTEEEDVTGCSFLLNLVDAFNGVEIIEEQLRGRGDYQEISHIMNVGMIYSFLHNSEAKCEGPAQRRDLMLKKFREKHLPLSSDEVNKIDKAHSTFWREWKLKLEEQKHIADHSRMLEQIIPGVDIERFLSGDFNYIQSMVFSVIESLKFEKKHILKDVLKLSDVYGLSRTEVLLRCISSILISEVWSNDDITTEISDLKGDMLSCAPESLKTISLIVYTEIDGCNKQRLSYIYGLLSECYLELEKTEDSLPIMCADLVQGSIHDLVRYYKVIEQECLRVSFIETLNFKNIAGLGGLNLECFNSEVYSHIDEFSLEPLAKLVDGLLSTYGDSLSKTLISGQDVYKQYVLSLLTTLETKAKIDSRFRNPEHLQSLVIELEQAYNYCMKYIRLMAYSDALDIMKQYFTVIIPPSGFSESLACNSTWKDCLIMLINFWIRLAGDMQEITPDETSYELKFNAEYIVKCLRGFLRLVVDEAVPSSQGWATVSGYVNDGIVGGAGTEVFIFCRAMIFSGCGFGAVAEVFSEVTSLVNVTLSNDIERNTNHMYDLTHLYLRILEPILKDLVCGTHGCQSLFNLLSSLIYLEGDVEVLTGVRHAVWERMVKFSDDLQLPSHVRVYALELLQRVSGRNMCCNSVEQKFNVQPWKGWDELPYTNESRIGTNGPSDGVDTPNRFKNTLVALKSSQLVAAILPGMEITPNELLTVDTALSCYSKLCEAATASPHIDALLAILEEWEGLFIRGKEEEVSTVEACIEVNDWNNDDWDEGWESFQEEPPKEEKRERILSLHPLHACWMELMKKLVMMSLFKDILKLMDQSEGKALGALLNEDSAKSLCQTMLVIDCFVALKMALLLPYEEIRFQCLDVVESKLKQGAIADAVGNDHEFLLLALSSDIVSTIITEPSYGSTFSYISYLVGNLSRRFQEAELSKYRDREERDVSPNNENRILLFKKVLFPCFVSKLVKADQHILAGFVVTKFMHTNTSLCLINIAEASLRRFLGSWLLDFQDHGLALEELSSSETLRNTVTRLGGNVEDVLKSAILRLPT